MHTMNGDGATWYQYPSAGLINCSTEGGCPALAGRPGCSICGAHDPLKRTGCKSSNGFQQPQPPRANCGVRLIRASPRFCGNGVSWLNALVLLGTVSLQNGKAAANARELEPPGQSDSFSRSRARAGCRRVVQGRATISVLGKMMGLRSTHLKKLEERQSHIENSLRSPNSPKS
jgi:hypothetical protein